MYGLRSDKKMRILLKQIKNLKKSSLEKAINKRLKEFRQKRRAGANEIFQELCFCILTANYSAEGGIRIQNKIGNGLCSLPEPRLRQELKQLGHRFPNKRSAYICEARKHQKNLLMTLKTLKSNELREWLVNNVKGLGMKEASHFLRNIGHDDYAIIDFHIIDLLAKHGLINRPKTLNRKRYLEIEEILRTISDKAKLSLAELDLYLWYMETGKVLK